MDFGGDNPIWGAAEGYIPKEESEGTKLEVWSLYGKEFLVRISHCSHWLNLLGTPTKVAHGTILPTSILKAKQPNNPLFSIHKSHCFRIHFQHDFRSFRLLVPRILLDPERNYWIFWEPCLLPHEWPSQCGAMPQGWLETVRSLLNRGSVCVGVLWGEQSACILQLWSLDITGGMAFLKLWGIFSLKWHLNWLPSSEVQGEASWQKSWYPVAIKG